VGGASEAEASSKLRSSKSESLACDCIGVVLSLIRKSLTPRPVQPYLDPSFQVTAHASLVGRERKTRPCNAFVLLYCSFKNRVYVENDLQEPRFYMFICRGTPNRIFVHRQSSLFECGHSIIDECTSLTTRGDPLCQITTSRSHVPIRRSQGFGYSIRVEEVGEAGAGEEYSYIARENYSRHFKLFQVSLARIDELQFKCSSPRDQKTDVMLKMQFIDDYDRDDADWLGCQAAGFAGATSMRWAAVIQPMKLIYSS
jgi:hypothetical protein